MNDKAIDAAQKLRRHYQDASSRIAQYCRDYGVTAPEDIPEKYTYAFEGKITADLIDCACDACVS